MNIDYQHKIDSYISNHQKAWKERRKRKTGESNYISAHHICEFVSMSVSEVEEYLKVCKLVCLSFVNPGFRIYKIL